MGSSKQPKKKPKKLDGEPRGAMAVGASTAAGERSPLDRDTLAQLEEAVGRLAEHLAAVEDKVDRMVQLQHRTTTLLELLAGSAFDLELGASPPS